MTKDEIISMALSVVPEVDKEDAQGFEILRLTYSEIVRFAALVAEKERERFSLECIDLVAMYGGPVDLEAAIRARAEND